MAIMIIPPPRPEGHGGATRAAARIMPAKLGEHSKHEVYDDCTLRQPSIKHELLQICQGGAMGDRGQHTRETGNFADPSIAHARLVLTLFQHESSKLLS